MGLPLRKTSRPPARTRQRAASTPDDDPIVTVQDAWLDEEESAPWCVDQGASIRVMSSRAVYEAVAEGGLTPDMKVWRDGRACWLPIAECYELTVKPKPRRQQTPVSGVRRVKRVESSSDRDSAEMWLEDRESAIGEPAPRKTLMLTTSFALGVIIGALLYLPFAW